MSAITTQTLREKLLAAMDGLERGTVDVAAAREMVKVSNAIIETAKLELEFAKTQSVLDKHNTGIDAGPLLLGEMKQDEA